MTFVSILLVVKAREYFVKLFSCHGNPHVYIISLFFFAYAYVTFSSYPAELLRTTFHSFEAGIANAISSSK